MRARTTRTTRTRTTIPKKVVEEDDDVINDEEARFLFLSSFLPFFLSCERVFVSLIEAVEGTTKILKMSRACVKVPKACSRRRNEERERERRKENDGETKVAVVHFAFFSFCSSSALSVVEKTAPRSRRVF